MTTSPSVIVFDVNETLSGTPYPHAFTPPTLHATGLTDLAGQLG